MKHKLLYLIISTSLVFANLNAQDKYLKITLEDDTVVNFPPNSRFILEDKKGKILLYPDRLAELGSFDISQEVKLYVFSSWKEDPDIFELKRGRVSLESPRLLAYAKPKKKKKSKSQYGDPIGVSEKRIIPNSDGTNDLSLVFDNGIIFYYRDGKASAWLNGETLSIYGKYIIESALGTIKMSYDPYTTVIWYVFEAKD